jgi:hypothetical protein
MAAALGAMRPFLRLRNQQAEVGLAYLALPRVKRGWQGKTLDTDWSERDDMKRRLTLLNKRGAA